jgi:hypothetical protein
MPQKKTILLIFIAVAFAIAGCWYIYSKYFTDNNTDQAQIIGGDKDEGGCLIGAGYSWCESKQKCLRVWEEKCDPSFMKRGNLTNATADETKNEWLLVYEEPGKPALNNKLIFSDKSVCYLTDGTQSTCSEIKFKSGDNVEISGEIKDGKVTISELVLIKVTEQGEEYNKEKMCIQVITPAKNPSTGETKDFSTPCDVPVGWKIISEASF